MLNLELIFIEYYILKNTQSPHKKLIIHLTLIVYSIVWINTRLGNLINLQLENSWPKTHSLQYSSSNYFFETKRANIQNPDNNIECNNNTFGIVARSRRSPGGKTPPAILINAAPRERRHPRGQSPIQTPRDPRAAGRFDRLRSFSPGAAKLEYTRYLAARVKVQRSARGKGAEKSLAEARAGKKRAIKSLTNSVSSSAAPAGQLPMQIPAVLAALYLFPNGSGRARLI